MRMSAPLRSIRAGLGAGLAGFVGDGSGLGASWAKADDQAQPTTRARSNGVAHLTAPVPGWRLPASVIQHRVKRRHGIFNAGGLPVAIVVRAERRLVQGEGDAQPDAPIALAARRSRE